MNTPLYTLARPPVYAMKALDPRLLLRASYVGRIAITLAIFFAVGFVFQDADADDRLIATLLLVAAGIFTAVSAAWSEFQNRSLNDTFLGGQILFDLVLVTGLVHVTGGGASQFGALYILVIAVAALMLTASAGLLVAALGCALYFTDVILAHRSSLDLGYWLQLGVFAGVALSSGYIASRLREARAGREELAAELVKVRLQAEDILRNIRSGIVTVDAAGNLVYANPAASALLGMDLSAKGGRRAPRRDLVGGRRGDTHARCVRVCSSSPSSAPKPAPRSKPRRPRPASSPEQPLNSFHQAARKIGLPFLRPIRSRTT